MAKAIKSWIVLLRAIGPATHKKMSMQQLRDACTQAGLEDVRTYIASGNLLFRSSLSKSRLQELIEGIVSEFGLDNDVIIRTPAELKALLSEAPLPQTAKQRPNHLLIVFFNRAVNNKLLDNLASRQLPEKIVPLQRELCIDYVNGVSRSKLTPVLLDRTIGQAGTARNWNTVNKLVTLSEVF